MASKIKAAELTPEAQRLVAIPAKEIAALFPNYEQKELAAKGAEAECAATRLKLGVHLAEVKFLLSRKGMKGQWSAFLRWKNIPRTTADRLVNRYQATLAPKENRSTGALQLTPMAPVSDGPEQECVRLFSQAPRKLKELLSTPDGVFQVVSRLQQLPGVNAEQIEDGILFRRPSPPPKPPAPAESASSPEVVPVEEDEPPVSPEVPAIVITPAAPCTVQVQRIDPVAVEPEGEEQPHDPVRQRIHACLDILMQPGRQDPYVSIQLERGHPRWKSLEAEVKIAARERCPGYACTTDPDGHRLWVRLDVSATAVPADSPVSSRVPALLPMQRQLETKLPLSIEFADPLTRRIHEILARDAKAGEGSQGGIIRLKPGDPRWATVEDEIMAMARVCFPRYSCMVDRFGNELMLSLVSRDYSGDA